MTAIATNPLAARQALVRQVIISIIAGMVLGMWTMLVEGVLHAGESFLAGLVSPLNYIAATVLGGLGNPNFYLAGQLPPLDPLTILLGLMGHMMNSVILGLIFYGIAGRLTQDRRTLLLAGVIYGVVVLLGLWILVLPVLDPVMLRVNFLAFVLGHMMFGAVLGLGTLWARAGHV